MGKFEPESLPEDVATAQHELEQRKQPREIEVKLYERTMMRCRTCRRWISIGPKQSASCPACSADGITAVLEVVDMAAHKASLPMKVDAPEEVQKFQQQKSKLT